MLFIYCVYSAIINKFYFKWPLYTLSLLLTVIFWIFYIPLLEILLGVFRCENNHLIGDKLTECYSGVHIFFIVLSVILSIILLAILTLIPFFYNDSQLNQHDTFAQ